MARESRWTAVAGFSLVGAATQMTWLTFAPVTTVAADRFEVSETAVGWLANLFVLAFVVLAIPAGVLLDRHLRPMLLLGAALTAVGACLRLLGDDYAWMLAGGAVAALGQPIVLTGITGLTRHYLHPRDRAGGIAVATASTWAGFIAAFGLGAVFSTADRLPGLVTVHAAFAVVAALVMLVTLRGPAPFAEPRATGADGAAAATRLSMRDLRATWSDVLVRRLCLFAFLPFGTFVAITTWTQALLEPAGVTVDQVGAILTAAVVAGVVGTAVLPVAAARTRREVAVGAVGIVLTALVCVILAVAPGFGTGLVGLTLAGAVLLPMLAISLELVERRSGETEGTASGLVWTAGNLGGLVVSGVLGLTLASPATSFLVLAAISVLALPLLARLRAPIAALPPVHKVTSRAAGDPLPESSGPRAE